MECILRNDRMFSRKRLSGEVNEGMMRGVLWLTLAIFIPLVGLPATEAQPPEPFSTDERAYLESRAPLAVVSDPSYPPFSIRDDDGTWRGIDIDLLSIVSAQTGIEFRMVNASSWTEGYQMLLADDADLSSAMVLSPAREAELTFSEPYAWIRFAFWVDEGRSTLDSVDAMTDHRVGVGAGYASETRLAEIQPAAIQVPVATVREGLALLQAGELDAFYGAVPTVAYELRLAGHAGVRPIDDELPAVPVHFTTRVEDQRLSGLFQRALATVSDEQREIVFMKWTGTSLAAPANEPPLFSPAARNAVLASIVALAVVGSWSLALRVQVGRRTRSLDSANELLQKELQARKEAERLQRAAAERLVLAETHLEETETATTFLHSTVHEIRTPMSPMAIHLHLLATGALGPLTERQHESVAILRRNVNRLAALTRDVSDVGRIRRGQLSLAIERIDLAALARETAQTFEPACRADNVRLDVVSDEKLDVEADASRLEQVLLNLLTNAQKATPPGGLITVRTSRTAQEIIVEVADTGVGLEPEEAAGLFQPFAQAGTSSSKKKGTGLGLYISRGIIEAHGGRIWCQSDGRGSGTTFGFALPPVGEDSLVLANPREQ